MSTHAAKRPRRDALSLDSLDLAALDADVAAAMRAASELRTVAAADAARESTFPFLADESSPQYAAHAAAMRAAATAEAAAALDTLRELRWLPAVRTLWLGHAQRPSAEDAAEGGAADANAPAARALLPTLTRDVVRIIADAIVEARAEEEEPEQQVDITEPAAGEAAARRVKVAQIGRRLHEMSVS